MRFISRLFGESDTPQLRPVVGGPVSNSLHPVVEGGGWDSPSSFAGGTLRCACTEAPVTIEVSEQITHPRLCGCTRCWKPQGALFAYAGFVKARKVRVVAGAEKLDVVDPSMPIRRRACIACDVHLFGLVEDERQAFHGLALVHPDRSDVQGWAMPTFASYCSSLIEAGTPPSRMSSIRTRLVEVGLVPYDCLSPDLMDAIAARRARNSGVLP